MKTNGPSVLLDNQRVYVRGGGDWMRFRIASPNPPVCVWCWDRIKPLKGFFVFDHACNRGVCDTCLDELRNLAEAPRQLWWSSWSRTYLGLGLALRHRYDAEVSTRCGDFSRCAADLFDEGWLYTTDLVEIQGYAGSWGAL